VLPYFISLSLSHGMTSRSPSHSRQGQFVGERIVGYSSQRCITVSPNEQHALLWSSETNVMCVTNRQRNVNSINTDVFSKADGAV
jgi:hypothetical protein